MNPFSLIRKAFNVFKKKSGKPEQPPEAPFEPDDNVVLVFGHSNAGKTVYFAVLYELLKGLTGFKLSPLDNPTAQALIVNFNMMRGKDVKIKDGRQVETEGQRRFPTMTSETRVLKFALDLHARKGIKFYTVDYKGETLSIAEPGELRQQFAKFFPYCRAALFFFDASATETDVLLREQIAGFQTIISDLRDECKKKMPIGVVITKSDFLDGFSPANPVELVSGLGALHKGRRWERFAKGVTDVNRRRFGERWAKSTEKVVRALGNLVDTLVGYSLDFQFFFVSATGGIAKTPSGEVEPPSELRPVGVEAPLMWAFKRILANNRKYFWWHKVKWVGALCLVWFVFMLAVNLFHVVVHYSDLTLANENYRRRINDHELPLTYKQFYSLDDYYERYLKFFTVDEFFGAGKLVEYAEARIESILVKVDENVSERAETASRKGGWNDNTREYAQVYNRQMADLDDVPLDQRQAELEKRSGEYQQEHDFKSDTLVDPSLANAIKQREKSYSKSVSIYLDKPFTITLKVHNLDEDAQVGITFGDRAEVTFSQLAIEGEIKNEKQVSGVIKELITFTYTKLRDRSYVPLIQKESNPAENFYPRLKNGGYTLHFGRSYKLKVKMTEGPLPPPPSWRGL